MKDWPKVSIITPATHDRAPMCVRLAQMFSVQDYEGEIEHLWAWGSGSIGSKLNALCEAATGQIILRADSDDIYGHDWVRLSVSALLETGADITGLSHAYFYHTDRQQVYEYVSGRHDLMCGATLSFHKHVWEQRPFPNKSHGEDIEFIANRRYVHSHPNRNSFIAVVHGKNTESHKAIPLLRPVNITLPLLQWI